MKTLALSIVLLLSLAAASQAQNWGMYPSYGPVINYNYPPRSYRPIVVIIDDGDAYRYNVYRRAGYGSFNNRYYYGW